MGEGTRPVSGEPFACPRFANRYNGSPLTNRANQPALQPLLRENQVLAMKGFPSPQGLYDPRHEHDACGVGFICHIKGTASHAIVSDALQMLENMNHRGACGCESDSGDGAGILVRLPDGFLREKCKALGITLPKLGHYATGNVFLPKELVARQQAERAFEKVIKEYGMTVLGWRDVPVNSTFVGPTPRKVE